MIDLIKGAKGVYQGEPMMTKGEGEQPAYLRAGDKIEIARRTVNPLTKRVAYVTVEVLGGRDNGTENWVNVAGESCIMNRFGQFHELTPEQLEAFKPLPR